MVTSLPLPISFTSIHSSVMNFATVCVVRVCFQNDESNYCWGWNELEHTFGIAR